ncbi:MAG: YggT family protein [Prevotellaceae bacterium]|jgi:hypothetical protein|nr:YggT family protein [Prevotellaceae bacterium]
MKWLLYILANALIVALFLYSKLTPHKAKLTGKCQVAFQFFERIFRPMLNLLQKIAKPAQVGSGIAVDMSQVVLLIILLILVKIL